MTDKIKEALTGKRVETTRTRDVTPIGTPRPVLHVSGKAPDKHYVWVNDNNVDTFLDSGYDFVPPDSGVKVSTGSMRYGSQIGERIQRPVGAGVQAYLMYIDKDIYETVHMAAEAAKVDENEEQMFRDAQKNGLVGSLTMGRRKTTI